MKTLWKNSIRVAASVALTITAYASDWAGGPGNWSSNANPGWNGTGVPNAIGAVANFPDAGLGVTANDVVGGVILGTLNLNGTANVTRGLSLANNLTMNQDGAGAGFATIRNSNPFAGTINSLLIGSGVGALVLADNLLIINTGGSTANGAISVGALIQGTGNITLSSVANTVTSASDYPGAIRVNNSNTFLGNVLIQKGAVTFGQFNTFNGNGGNVITLGQAGQGSVTLMAISSNAENQANNIVVAAGTGGTTVLGSASTSAFILFSGTITLNGNLTINSFATDANGLGFSGAISGVGGLTFTGGGTDPALIISRLTNTGNSYQGGTLINVGTLIAAGDGTLGTGNVSLTAASVRLTLQGGTLNNYINNNATLSLLSTSILNLNFTGTPDTVAALVIDGVAQAPGVYNSGNLPSTITGTGSILVVPEPATWIAFAFGAVLLVALRGSRRMRTRN